MTSKNTPTNNNFRVVSLFAGIGGICMGFNSLGCKVIWANDFDPYAKVTYQLNFPETEFNSKSITEVLATEIPDHDILTAGFPCQAFSIAGYRNGFNDYRGNLFFEIERILNEHKNSPKAILLENVKNLKTHDNGRTFSEISNRLLKAGFYITTDVLNTAEYGNIPQNRERIYIVGFRDKAVLEKFQFPKPLKLTKPINSIIDFHKKQPDFFYYNESSPYYQMLKNNINTDQTVYQIRRIYVRENKSNLCPTLTANMGTGGHNVPIIRDQFGIRKLTPRECFLFQGFPKSYKFPENLARSHLYKQAGNSVSVPVIRRIAKNMIQALDESN